MKRVLAGLSASIALAITAGAAHSATITLAATSQGWLNQTVTEDVGNNNYLVGENEGSEYRDFFNFTLPSFAGQQVTSAVLTLVDPADSFAGGTPIVYQLTTTPSNTFASLGNGTDIGDYSISLASANRSFSLDLSNVSFTTGTFEISGRITSPALATGGNASEYLFAGSQGNIASLAITTSPSAVSAAPEPGAWALMLSGVGMLGAFLRIQNARRREDEVQGLCQLKCT